MLGSGNCILGDATKVDLSSFDAIWASPPCQSRSRAKLNDTFTNQLDYTKWCSQLSHNILWIENVITFDEHLKAKFEGNWIYNIYNAVQFVPLTNHIKQNRSRIIAGRYPLPRVYQRYRQRYPGTVPCIMATEWNDARRASRHFGRKLTLTECATYQGLELPESWLSVPSFCNNSGFVTYMNQLVIVYMARAFGTAVINNQNDLAHWAI